METFRLNMSTRTHDDIDTFLLCWLDIVVWKMTFNNVDDWEYELDRLEFDKKPGYDECPYLK